MKRLHVKKRVGKVQSGNQRKTVVGKEGDVSEVALHCDDAPQIHSNWGRPEGGISIDVHAKSRQTVIDGGELMVGFNQFKTVSFFKIEV